MSLRRPVIFAGALLLIAAGPAADDAPAVDFSEKQIRRILRLSPLPEPPAKGNRYADDARAARLGQALFFDPRLSADGTVSCATCHDPGAGFADGRPLAEGLGVKQRHTPALWNVAHNRWYFWDGRADSLWAQARHPIEDEKEMGASRLGLAHLLHEDPDYREAYRALFGPLPDLDDRGRFPEQGRPVAGDEAHPHHRAWSSMREADRDAVNRIMANAGKALDAYQRQLVSDDAPFDEFVEGLREGDPRKMAALSPSAQRGLELFVGKGECFLCHSGPNFTDGEFHDIRVPPLEGGTPTDPGRYRGLPLLQADLFNAAGAFSDDPEGPDAARLRFLARGPHLWGAFKTPSLRNVALTAPYMHQGQLKTLEEVIEYYSTLEGAVVSDHHDETILVPRNFTEQEKRDLLAFLESLTDDDVDPALLEAP